MTTVAEALKSVELYPILKSQDGKRWLYWDRSSQAWVVRGKAGPGRNKVLVETESEEEAVKVLLQE